MPIYSYSCDKCGNDFELLEGMTAEKTEKNCPACGSKNISKRLSNFSVGASSAGPACPTGTCPTGTCPF